MDALTIVEDEVREQIRQRGLDPAADPYGVRQLVEDAVTQYDRRSMVTALPLIGSVEKAVKHIVDAVAGFGELQPLLDDTSIEEIWINATIWTSLQVRRSASALSPQ
ncbi:hypothetical protein [Nesterenkonia sp. Act20]|uniref:hypothetical protein n=1 Tax=Nesterenkonia sp. Act20 TaxID=1483432 RepID=UPI001C447DF3|nr:hypothetical protein [Nesterenkonia sp. Act20]